MTGYEPASIQGEHVLLTGPIQGAVTLEDGRVIDVTQPAIVLSSEEEAAEVAHAIGKHWAQPENIHPGQIDVNEAGEVTVNEFVYDDSHHRAAKRRAKKKG